MAENKATLKKLDEMGKELAKLKDEKAKLSAKYDNVSAKETNVQEKFIDLLLSADKDCWVIKGIGKLSLSFRMFFSIKDYKKFVEFSKTKEAKKFGLTPETVADNTTVSAKGLGELLKEVVEARLQKVSEFDFEKKFGFSFCKKSYVTKSKGGK